jgi:hypothetical protein
MNNQKPHILFGNGFNLALQGLSHFNIKLDYNSIVSEVIKKTKTGSNLNKFLSQGALNADDKLSDIEKLLGILQYSVACLKYDRDIYATPISNYESLLQSDISELKKIVIEVLTDGSVHPQWSEIFNDKNNEYVLNCSQNLKNFQRIYTINYDLILYWLLAQTELLKTFKDGFSDRDVLKPKTSEEKLIENLFGFSSNNNLESIIFLHGALHLLRQGRNAYKIVRGQADMSLAKIKELLLKYLSEFDNMLVFDATSSGKLNEIYSNDYLVKAYDKLITIKGTIIIYGCKVFKDENNEDNDQHLWYRLINSKVNQIYIGRSSDNVSELEHEAKRLRDNFQKLKCTPEDIEIHCFSQIKHNIWEKPNFFQNILDDSTTSFVIQGS